MPSFVPKEELLEMAGHQAPPSPWLTIDQSQINQFADATRDHQFIHVDPEKAAQTPLGATIAHGFLTLSLLPHLADEHAIMPEGMLMAFNYGLNKVRFIQPVRVDSAVRLHSKIVAVTEKDPGRILVTTEATVEIRDEEKPALIAEMLSMFVVPA
ncbi:MAG: MaoC family dehydratase [Acidobacteriota bacterium]